MFRPIEDPLLLNALNELSRGINIISTYGQTHPAVETAAATTELALHELFATRKKFTIGTFNGTMTVDEIPIKATGTLLISLERRLNRLKITGLKIQKGIGKFELLQLAELLSIQEADAFRSGMSAANLSHIASEDAIYEAVREGQTVANEGDLMGMGGDGVLVLDDGDLGGGSGEGDGSPAVHVDQIVAFLKGDVDLDDNEELGEELTELAADPARLGKMIMESVSVRQSVSELSGESLGDIVLGCLRRTYTGLRKQPAFQTKEGKAELSKALLMLEENILEKMHALTGDANPELDRQIVQAIREMDETLGFEMAAMQYMEHRDAIEENRRELQSFIQAHGANTAKELLDESGFPGNEWRKIVVASGKGSGNGGSAPIMDGINTLTTVFERLETLMRTEGANGDKVKDLLGQANENLDDTLFNTREKLELLSQHLKEDQAGTIGGQGRHMTQDELLAALAEVAQELMQPLTAITASLEMMLEGFVGPVSDDQRDLLELAANSGEHLKFLMKALIDIVGCPTNKGVDSRYHTTSDKVISMQDTKDKDDLPLSYFQ